MPQDAKHSRKPRGIFESRPSPILTQSLLRTWYVFLPLIGIWLASARFIKPNLKKVQDEGTLQRLKNEQAGRQLLNQMNASEAVIRAATFERDSVLTPAIDRRIFLVDSSRAIVAGQRDEIEAILASADSLDDVTSRYGRRAASLAESLAAIGRENERLDSTHLALTDSLSRLAARAVETWTRAKERD
jgi:hypothetical protein